MIRIPLTQGYEALVDDEDAPLAEFKWCAHVKPRVVYACRRVKAASGGARQSTVYLHRAITGAPRGVKVDHANGDGLDCRRQNLRFASDAENSQNRRLNLRKRSPYKGVTWHKGERRWTAAIRVAGRRIWLGSFSSAEAAARVYDDAAREHHGPFARVNFPGQTEVAA